MTAPMAPPTITSDSTDSTGSWFQKNKTLAIAGGFGLVVLLYLYEKSKSSSSSSTSGGVVALPSTTSSAGATLSQPEQQYYAQLQALQDAINSQATAAYTPTLSTQPVSTGTPSVTSSPTATQAIVQQGSGYANSDNPNYVGISTTQEEQALASQGAPIYYQPQPNQFVQVPFGPSQPIFQPGTELFTGSQYIG